MPNLLNAQDILGIYYTPSGQEVVGVNGVSIQMAEGEVLGLAGSPAAASPPSARSSR